MKHCIVQYTINDDMVRIFQLIPIAVLTKEEFQKFDGAEVFGNVKGGRRDFTDEEFARLVDPKRT